MTVTQDTENQDYDWQADLGETDSSQADTDAAFTSTQEVTDESPEQPLYQISSPKRLSDRPMVLIGVVFGGMTAVIAAFVLGYAAFSTVGSAIQAEKHKTSDPATESFSPNTPFNQDGEITREQRLQEQLTAKETDASITRFNSAAKEPAPSKQASPPPSQPQQSRPQPPTPNRIVAPKVVYRDRVVTKPAPAPKPKVVYRDRVVTKTVPPKSAPTPPSIQASAPQVPQDPYAQWDQLASLGMVGGGEVASAPTSSPFSPQDALYIPQSNDVVPVFDPSTFPLSDAPLEPEVEKPSVNLPLGSIVKGKLMHDVSFVDGSTSTDKAVVELSEALGDIPKGAMISTQIKSVDDNGALSMEILGYEYKNIYQGVSLPEIQVTSASASSGGGNLGRVFKDVIGIGLDVLGNETGQDIQFDNGRIASISTDTSNGLLDRSVDAVSSRLLERNRSSARNTKRSPKVKQGSTVKFTVISPLS